MSEWQPIETAPKDGTAVLGATTDLFDGGCEVVFWDDDREMWGTNDGPYFFKGRFTHWMPLPEPPTI